MAVTTNKLVQAWSDASGYHYEAEFKGLSTDDKPTTCAVNSLFLELDTGDVYYFNNNSWSKIGS